MGTAMLVDVNRGYHGNEHRREPSLTQLSNGPVIYPLKSVLNELSFPTERPAASSATAFAATLSAREVERSENQ